LNFNYALDVVTNDEIGNREVAPCPVYGLHRMTNTYNTVNVKYGTSFIMQAAGEYKCYCGEFFVCMGRPHLGHPIGNYFYGGDIYDRQFYDGHAEWKSYISTPRYTSSSIVPGFRFYP
jgi:hypothetical protein